MYVLFLKTNNNYNIIIIIITDLRIGEELLRRSAPFEAEHDVFRIVHVELIAEVFDIVDRLFLDFHGQRGCQHRRVRGDDDEDEEKVANRGESSGKRSGRKKTQAIQSFERGLLTTDQF